MNLHLELGELFQTIQTALVPCFLLTGIGSILSVLSTRLARVIDRSRVLEDRLDSEPAGSHRDPRIELSVLYRRAQLINKAITLGTVCALLVCVVIAALFVGDSMDLELGHYIASSFVASMLCLIGSYGFFLREIFIATRSMSGNRAAINN